jgi:integrase
MRLIPPTKQNKFYRIEREINGFKSIISLTTTSETEAEIQLGKYKKAEAARNLLRELEADAHIFIFIDKLWEMYIAKNPKAGKPELKKQENRVKRFVAWCKKHGINDINRIDRTVADNFVTQVMSKNQKDHSKTLRGHTYNIKLIFWRAFFKKIINQTDLTENPFASIESENEDDSQHGRPFTDKEIERLEQRCIKAGKEWWEFFIISIFTGMRYADVCNFKWTEIHEEIIDGELHKYARVKMQKTKKKKKYATFAIPPDVWPILEKQKKLKKAFVLPLRHKAYRLHESTEFTTVFLPDCKIFSNDEIVVTVHCTRHTCASKLIELGASEEEALGWLGLSSAKLLLKIYSKDIKHKTEIGSKITFKNLTITNDLKTTPKQIA